MIDGLLLYDMLDRRAALAPRAPALTGGTRMWSYRELRDLSLAYAAWLGRQSVGRGDRVLIVAPHAAESAALVFATSRLGAISVIISDQIRPYLLEHVLHDSGPRLVLGTNEAAAMARGMVDVPVHNLGDLPPASAAGVPPTAPACLPTDPVAFIYTSGSTAMPKAVVSPHRQVLFATRAIQSRLRYRQDDTVWSCMPLSFDYGLYQIFLACVSGAHLVLGDAADAGPPLLGQLHEHRATVLPVVPSLAATLTRLITRSGRPPELLRMVTNTGAALSPAASTRLRELVPGLSVVHMFGLTECKRVSIAEPNVDLTRPGSVGSPLPGTEAYVVDPDGCRLPPGETGELVVRGPHVMAGYWRAPELTAARFRPDGAGGTLLYTGDYCRLDADGYLYVLGRADDIYKQHGFRVSALEVEAAAMDIPQVELAAVLPPTGDEGARLLVIGAITRTYLVKELANRLEEYKLPTQLSVVDTLPLSVNGKVDKRRLVRTQGDRDGERSLG
jgi:acyl-CoA synthetase (AMP-forming)/AMP-acid ligase II